MQFLSYLISGVSLGSIYAIIALGYTMVYGIAKMLNFAHGDVIMVGGYISFLAMTSLGLPTVAAVLLAMAVCTVLGVLIEGLAYKPLRSAPSLVLCSFSGRLMPTTGSMPGIKAFTAAVFGGIGSIPGAFLGGLLLGIIESMAKAYISTSLANSIVFAVLIVVLLVRPSGLLGKYTPEKV